MKITNIRIRFITLIALLWAAPVMAADKDSLDKSVPVSASPCFIIVSEKLVFDANRVISIEIMDNNITSRKVVINLGAQLLSIPQNDDATAIKYLADLVAVIQKSCH